MIRLDLACGDRETSGFEGVDLFAKTSHRVNLLRFPWPWCDSVVDEIRCSHFVEHIPMCYVDGGHIPAGEGDRDLWCAFFDECWRIMKPDAQMTVVVPHLQNKRAFQDPTHRRFISEANFQYLNATWRRRCGLGHYLGRADFDYSIQTAVYDPNGWDAQDLVVTLFARKA